ncbi:MAG: STAS domain-containing protein [Clostridiales bacterium]|nr:STAS domain-containing protein [Clostridiales bacterium]
MNIKCVKNGDVLYVMLIGELDEYSASYIRNKLDNIFENDTFESVVFELSDLEFMDSTGIGVLIGRYKKLVKNNKKIYISNPSNTIEKIFNMSGIYDIMPKIS